MRKRILSLLLCIVLCLSFAPTVVFAYSAGEIPGTTGTGTASDPVICDTFAELKAALQYQGDLYIRVDSFTNTTGLNYYSLKLGTDYTTRDAAIRIPAQTTKHLEINTTVDIRTTYLREEGDDVLYSTIANFGNLYISGSGSLCGGFNASLPNGVIYNTGGGSVTVSGNVTIDGSHSVTTAHGCAIYNHQGNLTISGGTFIGIGSSRSPDGRVSAVNVRENATANISGGHFKATNSSNAVGLIVNSNANVQLSGGTFEGIDAEDSGHNISDFLKSGCNYYKVTDDSLFDASAITTTSEALRVVEQTPITSVEVTPNVITIPKNSTYQFTATVNGTGSFSNEVTWSITGGDFGTNIDSTGLLSVAKANTENTIIVKATSVADPTKYGTATVTLTSATPENPTITSVEVTPNVITIPKNSTYQFTATVNGTGSFSNEVTWSITGGDFGTNIDSTGLLSVAKANTENTIIVKATSVADPTKYGTATVTLTSATPENPTITSVEVTPNVITIPMDSQQQFTATVRGTGSFSDEVTWSITGGNNGTNISSDGLLSVAQYNTASDTIIVKATSVADPTKYGTATVTLTSATPENPTITSVEVTPNVITIPMDSQQQFTATVRGTGSFSDEVTWSITGGNNGTNISSGGLLSVAQHNTASDTIIVKATSVADPTKYGTATVTLTSVNTYTVTYDANGGTGTMNPEICTIDAEKGYADYVFPACGFTAPEGKEFDCWTVEGITGSISPQTRHALFGDMIVKAVWKDSTAPQPTTYTVSFEMNGHGDQITAQMVNEGAKATKPADPTEIGYMFVGWYKDSSFATAWNFDTDTVTADTTLYALWAQNTTVYTIIAGANGEWTKGSTTGLAFTSDAPFDKFDSVKIDGTVIAAANYTAEVGSTKITLAPAYLETLSVGTHTIEIVSNDGSASTNFTVKSAEQPPVVPTNYTVTFNMNGHGDQITAQTVKEGEKATKPTDPTASGWTFNGWYADATFSAAFDFDTAINADTTIYAKWTKETSDPGTTDPQPATYTVTFNMNGHGTQVPAQTVEEGNKATKPTDPSASGYTFDGWYADATFSAKFNFDSAITANTTVYAKWTEVKKDEPSNPANPTKPADPTSPQTGDNSHLFLWVALLFISGGALAGTAVYGKKRKYSAK